MMTSSRRLADGGMRRLPLHDALDLAGRLYDELRKVASSDRAAHKLENNIDVLRELTLRRIVLDKLELELNNRNVIPVTLNTLSNLFSQVYTRTQ